MKIHINNNTPIPAMSVIGCEQSFGTERIEISFGAEWKKLKKHVTFYLSSEETITLPYKGLSIKIPAEVYRKAGVYSYVVKGESKNKSIVCRTGFLTVLKSPEEYIPSKKGIGSVAKKGVAQ